MPVQIQSPTGYKLAPIVFQPIAPSSYFHHELPAAPTPNLDKVAKAQAFGAMMKVLGELPGHMQKEYEAGKKRGTASVVQKQFNQALENTKQDPQLADFQVGADGSVTMKPLDPQRALYRRGYGANGKPSLHDREEAGFGITPPADPSAPTASPTTGGTPAKFKLGPRSSGNGFGGDTSGSAEPPLPTDPLGDLPPDPTPGQGDRPSTPAFRGLPQPGTEDAGDNDGTLDGVSLVSPEDRQKIEMGAQYVGKQLASLSIEQLNATAGGTGAPAEIPPFQPGAPAPADAPKLAFLKQQLVGLRANMGKAQIAGDNEKTKAWSELAEAAAQGIRDAGGNPDDIAPPAPVDIVAPPTVAAISQSAPDALPLSAFENPQPAVRTAKVNVAAPDNAVAPPDLDALKAQSRAAWLQAYKDEAAGKLNSDANKRGLELDKQIEALGGTPDDYSQDPEFLATNPGAQEPAPGAAPAVASAPAGKPTMAVGDDGQVAVKKAQPVTGRSVNHISGEIYLRNENGTVKTYDPITRNISLKTPDGRAFELLPGANTWKEVTDKTGNAPMLLKREAAGMGVNTDGMTTGQIAEAMDKKEKEEGIIRPSRMPTAMSLARMVVSHPALKHYPTIKEAKEAVDAAIANPDAGGNSDIAIVEGFQRMVNPGATVRAQTIDSMTKAAGWMQQFNPDFQWNRAIQGDKFSPEARQRIKKLADDIFDRATRNAMPQLNGLKRIAKSFGITNPDDFVSNVMVIAPVLAANGEEVPTPFGAAATGTAAHPAPAPAAGGAPGSSREMPVTVTTPEAYKALPSGTWVSDGKKVGKKP